MKLSDLQNKDIVNVNDGRNIGNIIDVKIDEASGNILSFVIEPNKNFFRLFSKNNNANNEIKWNSITKIGEDVILVNINS